MTEGVPADSFGDAQLYCCRPDEVPHQSLPPEGQTTLSRRTGGDPIRSLSWPGNIRELQNFIERSVILTPGDTLRPPLAGLKPPAQAEPPERPVTLEDTERDLICRPLRQTDGIIDGSRGAAAILG
jgi:DNA-binding NtrC family response regulator